MSDQEDEHRRLLGVGTSGYGLDDNDSEQNDSMWVPGTEVDTYNEKKENIKLASSRVRI